MWVVWIVFVLAVFVGGVFFIFEINVLNGSGEGTSFNKDSVVKGGYVNTHGHEQNITNGTEILEKEGGDSRGGISRDSVFICNRYQPLQYSIGSFIQDVECLVNGTTGCDKIKVKCSSELYNLDYNTGGVFGIRYSLTSGGDILDYDIDSGRVEPRRAEVFSVEFVKSGSFNVDNMGCLIDMDSVARKCIDGYWS